MGSRIVAGIIILKQLVHLLKSLSVFVQNLKIVHCGRDLGGATGVNGIFEAHIASATKHDDENKRTGNGRTKLTTGIEEQVLSKPRKEPETWRDGLFAKQDGKFLIKKS